MISRPNIYTLVLNWNGGDDTYRCVSSLQNAKHADFYHKIIIIDNGSTDDSLKMIEKGQWDVPVHIIRNNANLGYAGGNNVGIRYALKHNVDYIFVLNNDTIVDSNIFCEFLEAAQNQPKPGVLGARNFFMDRPNIVSFTGARWDNRSLEFLYPGEGEDESSLTSTPHSTDYVCGAAMFFEAGIAKHIGVLDERFYLTWEESDWCFRARRAGYNCTMIPNAKIWHSVAASFSGETSPLRVYFTIRNRLLWAEKNLPFPDRVRMFIKTFTSLTPGFYIKHNTDQPLYKRILWSSRQYYSDTIKAWRRPQHRARRIAIRDYILRSFGNCPDKIRDLNKQ